MARGKFITFEGIEGCGKSTQSALAANFLKMRGIPVLSTLEPGATELGETLRNLILKETGPTLFPEAELLLFGAARAEHVLELVLPALEDNVWIICDRFSDATLAYQGYGRGLSKAFIRRMNHFASQSLIPDLTILIDLPVEAGLKRARARSFTLTGREAGDRIEGEGLAFHRRIRNGYLTIARRESERFRIVDGLNDPNEIHQEICLYLEALL